MLENEKVWKTVTLNGQQVEVCEDGKVRYTVEDTITHAKRTVETYGHKTYLGYMAVNIKGKMYLVHRLVCTAFFDNTFAPRRTDGLASGDTRECQHTFERDNNAVSALCIVENHKINTQHPYSRRRYRTANKRLTKYYGGLEAINPKTGKVVKTFKTTWEDVAEWLCKPVSTIKGNIGHAINNKGKRPQTAYGFQWRHIPKTLNNWELHLKQYRADYYQKHKK